MTAASGTKVAVGVATFYTELAERLELSAMDSLIKAGISQIERFEVPGAFELPVIAKYAADAGFDAVILLGAVIRGQTSHYDHVCEEVARGSWRSSSPPACRAASAC